MRSRAPKVANPRRVSSSYLLSGLVKCHRCNRAFSGQDAKSGQFAYYVCQSLIKRGSGACDSPRLNARRFEELVVGKIRSNILTEGSITDLVKAVDEEMDGVAREQRKRLETIDSELADVRRRLDRLYNLVETTDMDIDDFKPRIRDHRERQERLEDSAAEARGHPRRAQVRPGRREHHRGLRPGDEGLPGRERADRSAEPSSSPSSRRSSSRPTTP